MTHWLLLGMALATGIATAVVHFAGLWLTVHRVPHSSRSAQLMLGSSLLRTIITMAGFFVLARADARLLPVSMLAFVVTRLAVLLILGGQGSPALGMGRRLWN